MEANDQENIQETKSFYPPDVSAIEMNNKLSLYFMKNVSKLIS